MGINRREFCVISSAALAGTAFGDLLLAQTPQTAPAGAFEAIRRNVGTFTSRGGTIGFLINKEAVVVIDTQYANTAPICIEGLKERSAGRIIDLVFNTHHHGDHTGGNGVFKDASKKIVAHSRVPELMKQAAAAQANASATAQVLPTATFDQTWSEPMGDETVSARHYGPGHTGGDAVIRFERANVIHMGDLLFHELHPRVDRPGGASIQNWMKTLVTIAKGQSRDTRFIAGHSRPGQPVVQDSAALLKLRDYFDAALTYVRKGMADKKTKEEVSALAALPGFEHYQAPAPTITLAGVLSAAYDELGSADQPR